MQLIWHDTDGNSTINKYDPGTNITSLPLRLTTLKQVLIAAGWTVVASSNGTTKVVGSDNSGTFAAANCWVILQDPSGTRCFGFAMPTDKYHVTIKYVAAGGVNTTTGSATTMCTANVTAEDIAVVTNLTVGYAAMYFHAVADAEAPYGFYLIGAITLQPTAVTTSGFSIIYDPLESTNAGELDPYAILIMRDNFNSQLTLWSTGVTTNLTFASGWKFKGTASAAYGALNLLTWKCATESWNEDRCLLFPNGLAGDMHRGHELTFLPAMWCTQNGFKGVSTMLHYSGSLYRPYGTTCSVSSSRDRIFWSKFTLPWVGQKVAM